MLIDYQAGHDHINIKSVCKRLSMRLLLLASLAGFGFTTAAQAQVVSQIENLEGVCAADILGSARP